MLCLICSIIKIPYQLMSANLVLPWTTHFISAHISDLSRDTYTRSSCNLRRLYVLYNALFIPVSSPTVQAVICTRVDYCNSLFIDLLKSRLAPLQSVPNAAACLIASNFFNSIDFLFLHGFSLKFSSSFMKPCYTGLPAIIRSVVFSLHMISHFDL